jgi:hypothetical protein
MGFFCLETIEPAQVAAYDLIFCRSWPLVTAIIITFATTFAIFPALVSSVRSLHARDGTMINTDSFLPVACILVNDAGDTAGRLIHGLGPRLVPVHLAETVGSLMAVVAVFGDFIGSCSSFAMVFGL